MPEVIIHDDESFERALKRFKKKCEKAGILSDLRKHRHFEKPSEKRKRKMNAAVRKNSSWPPCPPSLSVGRGPAGRDERRPQGPGQGSHARAGHHPGQPEEPRDRAPAPATDDDVIEVLRKGIKTRRESVEQYTAANRPELAEIGAVADPGAGGIPAAGGGSRGDPGRRAGRHRGRRQGRRQGDGRR